MSRFCINNFPQQHSKSPAPGHTHAPPSSSEQADQPAEPSPELQQQRPKILKAAAAFDSQQRPFGAPPLLNRRQEAHNAGSTDTPPAGAAANSEQEVSTPPSPPEQPVVEGSAGGGEQEASSSTPQPPQPEAEGSGNRVEQEASAPRAFSPTPKPQPISDPTERAVPAGPLARVWGFGTVAVQLAGSLVADKTWRSWGKAPEQAVADAGGETGSDKQQPGKAKLSVLSENNAEILAAGLCRMRGAALKVGQMLSIQDESLVPQHLQDILKRVRDGADVMPRRQLEATLATELGEHWETKLKSFDRRPIAAASIGQVHRGVLHDGTEVVLKVQYPGVAESINSDVENLKRLLKYTGTMPKGMYLDEAMAAAKEELTMECDYRIEAGFQRRFRELYMDDPRVNVPRVIDELSTQRILTSELVSGYPIDRLAVDAEGGPAEKLDQATRNDVAGILIEICLKELFEFRVMQTDPNWSNFLYDPETGVINLIDFGASREFSKSFVDEYLRVVHAFAKRDRKQAYESSVKLGFLTGDESKTMIDAHVDAGFIVGEPFAENSGAYDFVKGNIPARVGELASVMVKQRLRPPPKEAYTLHRKLSGAFLTSKKLGAVIPCEEKFLKVWNNYNWNEEK